VDKPLSTEEVLKVLEQSLACMVQAKVLCERSLLLREQSRRIHEQGLELAERACGLKRGPVPLDKL
jgi:hypothetical protein